MEDERRASDIGILCPDSQHCQAKNLFITFIAFMNLRRDLSFLDLLTGFK
jgi:hypothetical protein